MEWEEPTREKKGQGAATGGTVVFLILTVLVLLCYLTIFLNPQIAFNPFKPPVLKLPSSAPKVAATELPTFTPPLTYPPTWTPTATPTATGTFTPRPTATPTFTPKPVPPFSLYWDPVYTKQKMYPDASGWWTGVAGEVADRAGKPVTNATIRIWDDFGHVWETEPGNAPDYADHYGSAYGGRGTYAWWEQFLYDSCKNSLTIHVQVFRNGQPASGVVTVNTTGDCDKNLVLIHFRKNY